MRIAAFPGATTTPYYRPDARLLHRSEPIASAATAERRPLAVCSMWGGFLKLQVVFQGSAVNADGQFRLRVGEQLKSISEKVRLGLHHHSAALIRLD